MLTNLRRINPALVFFNICKDEIAKSHSLGLKIFDLSGLRFATTC